MIYLQRTVAREAFEKSAPDGIAHALPEGFPFLVDSQTGRVVEPVLEYLHDRFVLRRGYDCHARLTVDVAAYELCHFFRHLQEKNLPWTEVQVGHIRTYRDGMYSAVSRKTGKKLCVSTIRRRVELVVDLYEKAAKRGRIAPLGLDQEMVQVRARIDATPLAHLGQQQFSRRFSIVPRRTSDDSGPVRYLTPEQGKRLLTTLGPRPDEQFPNAESTRFRDRLLVDLMLHTGLRCKELLGLQCSQFQSIKANEDRPYAAQSLRLTITKGDEPRKVLIPNHIISGIHWYIDHERKSAAAARKNLVGKQDHDVVFLHHVDAHGVAGKPLSYDSLRSMLAKAQVRAGLTEQRTRYVPNRGAESVEVPLITPHCLRHTFAVWMYWARKAQGDTEPWKSIQAALGHRSLQTTLDTYLKVIALDELHASDHLEYFDKAILDAQKKS